MTTNTLRLEVEDFLYREALLLDSWRLDEWLALFTPDAIYGVPAPDAPEGSFEESLFVIADDLPRLTDRVLQLMGNQAGPSGQDRERDE
jgi:p-cumate 2,3-dioxygenase beta subunit